MLRDPRNPQSAYMVLTKSAHPAHADLRQTITLLSIVTEAGPIYFVVEGVAQWPDSFEELNQHNRYFFEEHTCPTNFIRIPMISFNGDTDPHGIFRHIETVWMMDEYLAALGEGQADEYLVEVFPQLSKSEAGQGVNF